MVVRGRWMVAALLLGLGAGAAAQEEEQEERRKEGRRGRRPASEQESTDERKKVHAVHRLAPTTAPDRDEDVAFWVRLDGHDAPPIPVTVAEWDGYFGELYDVYPVEDHASFIYRMLQGMLDAKAVQLKYHDQIEPTLARVEEAMRKLERGTTWERVVRLYSTDAASKSDGGFQGEYRRSLLRYPLDHGLFEIEPGNAMGPFLTKWGAETIYCHSKQGQAGALQQRVEISLLLIPFGEGIGRLEWPHLRRRLRITCTNERFRQFLPPGLLDDPPATFGPTDVAPLGEPNARLERILDGPPLPPETGEESGEGD